MVFSRFSFVLTRFVSGFWLFHPTHQNFFMIFKISKQYLFLKFVSILWPCYLFLVLRSIFISSTDNLFLFEFLYCGQGLNPYNITSRIQVWYTTVLTADFCRISNIYTFFNSINRFKIATEFFIGSSTYRTTIIQDLYRFHGSTLW